MRQIGLLSAAPGELWINDPFGRNFAALPPSSSGDFVWVQHIVKSMAEGSRLDGISL